MHNIVILLKYTTNLAKSTEMILPRLMEAIEMMANSSESWSLCDNAPPPQVHPMLSLRLEMEYDQQVMERNQRLAY